MTPAKKSPNQPKYKILATVTSQDVPNWARRPPRWNDLIETVLALKKGQSLPIQFDDPKEAMRARNSVRDSLNMEAGKVALQTRIVNEGNKSIVYFTMLLEESEKPKSK